MVHKALEAAEDLAAQNVSAQVINMSTIKPLDSDLVLESARDTGAVVTAEDHNVIGGLGSAVAETLSGEPSATLARVGIDDEFGLTGTPEQLYEHFGLTSADIAETAMEIL
jgi:transketolase